MSESTGSSEFLLGIEEYLRYLNHNEYADSIHTLSRTINSDNKIDVVNAFMQDLGGLIQDQNINISDLLHRIVHAKNLEDTKISLLQYLGKIYSEKHLNDLIYGFIKSKNLLEISKVLLQYVGKNLTNKNLSDLALAISRSINSDNFDDDFIKAQLSMLDRNFLSDKIFRGINNLIKADVNRSTINDAFSRSQIRSKIWLVEELAKIQTHFNSVVVIAGWFGQIKSIYEKKLTYEKMRIVELDKNACEISDYNFNLSNLENYKVKSINADVNKLTLYKNGYEFEIENFKENKKYIEKFLPDLIINTSAEHMNEDWFFQLKFKEIESNPIVAIQSNNLFDVSDHINCVYSIDHMKKKFPMKEILFEGELQLKGYKRVMLIGRL